MVDWKERYMREVEGLNNEGDPIGGDPPSGLRHQVEALKAENEKQAIENRKNIAALKYEIDGMQDLNVTQAKRLAELEEYVTNLTSGSRQHLYQAFARRYKEILSLRRENEALRKIKEAAENLFSHKNNYHNEQKVIALTNALAKLNEGGRK